MHIQNNTTHMQNARVEHDMDRQTLTIANTISKANF